MQLAKTHMGLGKWSTGYWVYVIKSDKIFYEINRVLKTICMLVK